MNSLYLLLLIRVFLSFVFLNSHSIYKASIVAFSFICVFPQQYILVSFGNVIVASTEVHLCDRETHTVNVTVAGNGTTLEVDGQLGLTESVENLEPLDLSSSYSTFIGGIPG